MPFIRLALMKPREGRAEELQNLQEELIRYFKTLPGYLEGYLVETDDGSGRVGRVTMWEHDTDADRAAQQQHVLTIRSTMLRLIGDEESAVHREVALRATPV